MPESPELEALRALMRRLRDPHHGCPWDRAQSFASIVPYTLEEAYEVAAAIEAADFAALPDELGDLLFQVVFYAQLGEESGRFDFDDVVAAISAKLIERHPHVFGTAAGTDRAALAQAWEAHKAAARRQRAGHAASELDDVPRALPALARAQKIQRRAARVGFDWPHADGARAKLDEELEELDQAHAAGARERLEDELGDVLFTVVNLARHLDLDAESALRRATAKFERRFRALEAVLRARGETPEALDAERLERLWQAVKQRASED